MLSRAQNTFHHNPRLRGPVSSVLKKVIPWTQRMHRRTVTRVCIFFWDRPASFGHLGFISDPLIVSKFHNETYDPKGQEKKIYKIKYLSRIRHRV